MTTWIHAVCDEHKVHAPVLIVFNTTTLSNCAKAYHEKIADFLNEHVECELWLAWRDEQMDKLDAEYVDVHERDDWEGDQLHDRRCPDCGDEHRCLKER